MKEIVCKGCGQVFMPFLPDNRNSFGHSCTYCDEINTYEDYAKRLLLCLMFLTREEFISEKDMEI